MKRQIILLIVIAPTICSTFLGLIWGLTMPTSTHAKTAEASLLSLQGTPTVDLTVTALQKEQLTQEVTGLETDNTWYWIIWVKLSPSLTVLIGFVVGFGVFSVGYEIDETNRNDVKKICNSIE